MARPLRIEFGGALYHLTARGNARGNIFLDQRDCAKFVQFLVDSLERYDVALHAFVLMGNHYHLIAETRKANLGQWMHWLRFTSIDGIVVWAISFKGAIRVLWWKRKAIF